MNTVLSTLSGIDKISCIKNTKDDRYDCHFDKKETIHATKGVKTFFVSRLDEKDYYFDSTNSEPLFFEAFSPKDKKTTFECGKKEESDGFRIGCREVGL